MKQPSSRTIAAAVGALALSGVAVAAVAASDDTPQPATTDAATTQTGDDRRSAQPSSPPPASDSPAPRATGDSGDDGATAPAGGLTSDQAVAIAEQALADLGAAPALREVDREFEDGRDIWDIEFAGDHEVEVDAITGEVVKLEIDDDRDDHGDRDDDYDDYDDRDDYDD